MNCTRSFRRDWITKRTIKLVGQSMSATDARAQAKAEWEAKKTAEDAEKGTPE